MITHVVPWYVVCSTLMEVAQCHTSPKPKPSFLAMAPAMAEAMAIVLLSSIEMTHQPQTQTILSGHGLGHGRGHGYCSNIEMITGIGGSSVSHHTSPKPFFLAMVITMALILIL